MLLRDYLKREKLTYREFSQQLDTTSTTIYRIITGMNFPKIELARMIVEHTNGEVTLEDLYDERQKKPICPCCGHKLGKNTVLKVLGDKKCDS